MTPLSESEALQLVDAAAKLAIDAVAEERNSANIIEIQERAKALVAQALLAGSENSLRSLTWLLSALLGRKAHVCVVTGPA